MTAEEPETPAQPETPPAPAKAARKARVAVRWPFSRLEAAGHVVTREMTEVPAGALEEIRKLAAASGAALIEEG